MVGRHTAQFVWSEARYLGSGTKLGVEAVGTLGRGVESQRRGQSIVLEEVGRAKQAEGGGGQQRLVADAENTSPFQNRGVAAYS